MLSYLPVNLSRAYNYSGSSYFFTRVQAEETKQVIRQRYPVFQAIYFSSVLICSGVITIHFLYSYVGVMSREAR